MRYGEFIAGLQRAKVELDRKSLANIAIQDPDTFTKILELARANALNHRPDLHPTASADASAWLEATGRHTWELTFIEGQGFSVTFRVTG